MKAACLPVPGLIFLLCAVVSTAAYEFSTGPIIISRDVRGVPVSLSTMLYFRGEPAGDRFRIKSRAIGDLSDLQAKIGAIVDTFKLPTDNCGSYNADNPVVSISRKELGFRGGQLTFAISGNVTMWDCRENPVPKSKVEWVIEDVGFGIKTKVPKLITWPGDPIKNKLASQSFDAALPVGLSKVDDRTIQLELGRPDVELKGQFAFITNGILSIVGIDINNKLHEALKAAIEPETIRTSLPNEIMNYDPIIDSVGFSDRDGRLTIEVALSADLSAQDATKLIAEFLSKLSPGSQLKAKAPVPPGSTSAQRYFWRRQSC